VVGAVLRVRRRGGSTTRSVAVREPFALSAGAPSVGRVRSTAAEEVRLNEEQSTPTSSWLAPHSASEAAPSPVTEPSLTPGARPTAGLSSYPARPVRNGVDIVVRRSTGSRGLIVVTTITLMAGFGLAYFSNRQDASVGGHKPTPTTRPAANPSTGTLPGGRVGTVSRPPLTAPKPSNPPSSAVETTLVREPPVATPVPSAPAVSLAAPQASVTGSPRSLFETVSRVRFATADGTSCGEASGVFISADGLLLTARPPVPCGSSVDVLISQSASPEDAMSVRYRGHAVVDSEALGVALVQIDRDGQGRRLVPHLSTFATLAHAMPTAVATPGRLLFYADPAGAVLRNDAIGVRSSDGTAVANRLVVELGPPALPYGGALFDGAGNLVGLALPSGLKNGQVMAHSVAALSSLLQRVGVDYVPVRP
jgi:hypothetical protein